MKYPSDNKKNFIHVPYLMIDGVGLNSENILGRLNCLNFVKKSWWIGYIDWNVVHSGVMVFSRTPIEC